MLSNEKMFGQRFTTIRGPIDFARGASGQHELELDSLLDILETREPCPCSTSPTNDLLMNAAYCP